MFLVLILSSLVCVCSSENRTTFRAAVYEHAVILPPNRTTWVNRSEALTAMMKNLKIYREQAIEAGRQKVDILVFPEDGIYGMGFTRQGIQSYLEYIPEPEEHWNPCTNPEKHRNTEVQHELSCMAMKSSLYLVANMGDYQKCNSKIDQHCPTDGHYQFNTNVVYNSSGYLIAKYHKINLFFEKQFDYPPYPKTVTFDTDFGKFAVFTCFDIIFKNPAIDALQPDVGNVVFPTAWMDALPLLAAIQYHSAFAAGAKVNFLAANINLPSYRFQGSGIYTPKGYAAYRYNETSGGELLVAELPVVNNNSISGAKTVVAIPNKPASPDTFYSTVFHDLFTFAPITNKNGSLKVCNNGLCCFLDFELANPDDSELYAFGAFDGLHTYEGTYYLQICTLLKCTTTQRESCGEPIREANTIFKKIKVQGTFGTPYIFPEILLTNNTNLQLAVGTEWTFNKGVLNAANGFQAPILCVGLFARGFHKDHVYSSGQTPLKVSIVLKLFALCLNSLYLMR